jgi:hypothetical protein
MERYLWVNLLGLGPHLIKKELTGPRSHKGWETLLYVAYVSVEWFSNITFQTTLKAVGYVVILKNTELEVRRYPLYHPLFHIIFLAEYFALHIGHSCKVCSLHTDFLVKYHELNIRHRCKVSCVSCWALLLSIVRFVLDIRLSIMIFMWHSCKVSCFMLDFRVSVVRFMLDIVIPGVITQFVRHVSEGTLTIRVRMNGYWKVRNLKPVGSWQCFVKVVQLRERPLFSCQVSLSLCSYSKPGILNMSFAVAFIGVPQGGRRGSPPCV